MVVTDENGVEHMFEGTGFCGAPSATSKLGQPYVQSVTASINLAPKDVKNA